MTPAAYAQLDLNALLHNIQVARTIAPHAKIMAVIKANAYGHGLLRIATIIRQHVDAVAVARSDEGIRLRKAGFEKPITVLQGFVCPQELEALIAHQLDTVIHNSEQIATLQQNRIEKPLTAWLKMDTGMNRLGLNPQEYRRYYQDLAQNPAIKSPPGLMTHLANADDLSDPKTEQQLALFYQHIAGLPGPRSIANSAAVLRWPQAVSEWIRPGLMLFGCSPFPDKDGQQLGLRPVMSLHSRLIAVKRLLPGDSVGYGGSWVCQRETRLGVIAVGYGDGYPRHIAAGSPVLVNNQVVPLIGRVSMDMITVDLNQQPQAKPGDPVTLWGKSLPVEIIARAANTIPYTLLCGITQRVQIVES